MAEAKAAVKRACGCAVGINVKWDSYKKADDMFQVPNALHDIVSASTAQCTDDDEKKALGTSLKAYELVFDDSARIKLDGKKLTCGTASSTRCGDHQIKAVLDTF